MFAITPRGIGKKVGARSIRQGDSLMEGETFVVEDFQESMILDQDGASLVVGDDIELVRATYLTHVDEWAEFMRSKSQTKGATQSIVHQEKFSQAEAVRQLGKDEADCLSPSDYNDAYPLLAASVGIEAPTLWECAGIVMAAYFKFIREAANIEAQRLSTKRAIRNAPNSDRVVAAYEALEWTD